MALETKLRGKTIHGVYRQTLELKGIDRKSSTLWLQDGRVMAATEALIIAAENGALVIKRYWSQVWSAGGSTWCRACGNNDETIGMYCHHVNNVMEIV